MTTMTRSRCLAKALNDLRPVDPQHRWHLCTYDDDRHVGLHVCECGVSFVSDQPEQNRPEESAAGTGLVYLLWSQAHTAWWKPDGRGYHVDIDEAGRFSEADAIRYVVASAQSGIRDKVTFMVAAPDNWATPPVVNIVTECPDCKATGRYDGRVHIGGRGVYRCPNGHMWQDANETPDDHGYTPVTGGPS